MRTGGARLLKVRFGQTAREHALQALPDFDDIADLGEAARSANRREGARKRGIIDLPNAVFFQNADFKILHGMTLYLYATESTGANARGFTQFPEQKCVAPSPVQGRQ